MSTLLETLFKTPMSQLVAASVRIDEQQHRRIAAPAAARSHPGHLLNPQADIDPAALQAIMQRFLQDFEYVTLDYPVSGHVDDPKEPLEYHPHLVFRMCGDDRQAMDPEQVQVALSRQIDRGIYLLKRLGIESMEWYVSKEHGELRFDARVPNPPEGMSERQVLEAITEQLQAACNQARTNAKQPAPSR